MLKNPAEKEEPRKEGKHWGGERRERRIPETKACVSRRKEGATQLETKQKGPGQTKTQSILHGPFGGRGQSGGHGFSRREQKANCCWLRSE